MDHSIVSKFTVGKILMPRFMIPLKQNPKQCGKGSIDYLGLPISLWVTRGRERKFCSQPRPQGPSEMAQEFSIPIRHKCFGYTMEVNHFSKEQPCYVASIIYFVAWYKICHFRKSVHYHKYRLNTPRSPWKPQEKSILISSQGVEATGKGVYIPASIALDLACKQFKKLAQQFCISLFIWGQNNFSLSMANVLATPDEGLSCSFLILLNMV